MDTGFKLLLLLLFVVVYNGIICITIDRLKKRVEILELWMEYMEWIKCSDEMPEAYKHVLCYDSIFEIICEGMHGMPDSGWYLVDQKNHGRVAGKITHWMPLPQQPKE